MLPWTSSLLCPAQRGQPPAGQWLCFLLMLQQSQSSGQLLEFLLIPQYPWCGTLQLGLFFIYYVLPNSPWLSGTGSSFCCSSCMLRPWMSVGRAERPSGWVLLPGCWWCSSQWAGVLASLLEPQVAALPSPLGRSSEVTHAKPGIQPGIYFMPCRIPSGQRLPGPF